MANENQTNQTGATCVACGGPCTGTCWKRKVAGGLVLLALSGSLLLLALFASTLKEYQYIGRDVPGEQTTISVNGEGEEYAAPDIATISFSITQDAKTATEARKSVDDRMKKIHAFLTASGVKEKDIKATYSLYPKYEWRQTTKIYSPCISGYCPPVDGQQVLIGYEVTESVEVKIRDIDKNADSAGVIIGGLADNGASNINGPNFSLEDEDGVKEVARKEAIKEAKAKAEKLADELGVTLVRVTSFSEGGNYPIYGYGRGGAEMKTMATDSAMAPEAANIPAGENKYTSNVTITYEVR